MKERESSPWNIKEIFEIQTVLWGKSFYEGKHRKLTVGFRKLDI